MSDTFLAWTADAGLAGFLLAAATFDVRRGRIPNWLTFGGAAAGLLFWTFAGLAFGGVGQMWSGLGHSAAGLAAAFAPTFILWLVGGIHGGDAKAAGAAGAWIAGVRFALYGLLYTCVVAGLLAVIVMIRRRVVKRTLGRIWRFLWIAASGGRPASPTDRDSQKLAWSVALAIGMLLAAVERRLDQPLLGWLFG